MKINCEKCQAKYSIADEKVRGKTFKIRCKKCGHVIIVRDKGAAAGSDSAAASPAAAAAEAAGWHVAVGGETIGPLTEQDIRARIEQGEYRQDASVWRDGFEDWVPMHTVEVFGSVLERVTASGKDSSSGTGSLNMGGSADPGLGDGGMTPSSPRVQSLTGQRNENSVLFSLDSLQKVGSGAQSTSSPAQTGAAAAATLSPGLSPQTEPLSGPGGSFTPSTAAPTSEGSGLIDIRAMSEVLSKGAAEPKRDDSLLPSFGGSGLGGLAAQPVAVEEPLPAVQDRGVAPAPAPARSNVGLIMAATLGSVGLALGLGYFFVLEPMMEKGADAAEQQIKLARAEERAKFAQQELERERKEREAAVKEAEAQKDAAQAGGGDSPAAEPSAQEGAAKRERGARNPQRRRPSGAAASDSGGSKPAGGGGSKPASEAKPKSRPAKAGGGGEDSSIDVDCLLDPGLPKCKKSGGSRKKASAKPRGGGSSPKPAADSNLPASLTQAQLLGGLRNAKSRAKSCGSKHGASAGTRVRVRMSISGSTGKVTSAVPQGEHASTPLGKCVAAAASKASFPKFKKSSQGLQYNFKM